MANRQLQSVIHDLRATLVSKDTSGAADSLLLERFLSQRDEAAFELLIWRHGKMVFDTCCRVLRDQHDAEDAFQACFLVLAQRAGSIGLRESLGGWLYRVAYRLSLRTKSGRNKREARQEPLNELLPVKGLCDPASAAAQRELRCVLDEEVNRLPLKLQVPFVLRYFEGLTNAAVARELGCPLGTIESRLNRARSRLRGGLARRGVTLSTGLLAALSAPSNASALVPAALVARTAKAALVATVNQAMAAGFISTKVATLTEGILRGMALTKLNAAAIILLTLTFVGSGTGALMYATHAAEQPAAAAKAQPKKVAAADAAARLAKLIDQLGSDKFAEREQATKALLQRGSAALDDLRKAAQSGNAEKRSRAAALVHQIEGDALKVQLLAARHVHLVYKDTPLPEALADFTKQSGYDLFLDDSKGNLKERKVTLDTGDVTFCRALDLFCQKAGLVETAPKVAAPPGEDCVAVVLVAGGVGLGASHITLAPPGVNAIFNPAGQGGGPGQQIAFAGKGDMNDGAPILGKPNGTQPLSLRSRVGLTDGKTRALPTDDRTAVRIRALDRTDKLESPPTHEILVTLELTPELKLHWQRILDVHIRKATDDQGQDLDPWTEDEKIVAAKPAGQSPVGPPRNGKPVAAPIPYGPDQEMRSELTQLRLKEGAKAAKFLKEVSGTIVANVLAEAKSLVTVDNVLQSAGETVKGAGDCSIQVLNVTTDPSGTVQILFELTLPRDLGLGDSSLRLSSLEGVLKMRNDALPLWKSPGLELTLLDQEGNILPPSRLEFHTSAKAIGFAMYYHPRKGEGQPARLNFSVRKAVTIDVPFTLKDVPLPKRSRGTSRFEGAL